MKSKFRLVLQPIFDFELNGKGHEPSQAENPSVQAMVKPARLRLITSSCPFISLLFISDTNGWFVAEE